MRLRTRFVLLFGLASTLAAAVILFAVGEIRALSAAAEASGRGQRVLTDTRALLGFTYEYALYGQPRAAQQWRLAHAELTAALGRATAGGGGIGAPDFAADLVFLSVLFERLEQARTQRDADPLAPRRAELLTDSLIVGAQSILDDTDEWVNQLSAQREVGERRLAAVGIAALTLLVGLIVVGWRSLAVEVMRPLRRLQQAMDEVTAGDLSARSALARRDEIGELSSAFDAMTSALQAAVARHVEDEQQLRRITGALPVRIARSDRDERYRFVNPALCAFYGVSSEAEMLGRTVLEMRGPAGYAAMKPHIDAVLAGQTVSFVLDEHERAGKPQWSALTLLPDLADDGSVNGWYAMSVDITELTLNRQRIEQQLVEKDVLLREVHHRVKNNLQVVTSLLSLQATMAGDPALRVHFEESCARIRSMALIHEKLYRSESFSAVDFGEYLRTLVSMIASSQGRPDVATDVQVQGLPLDIGRAVPAALVVNELVSNSYKHGFPPGRRGRVAVTFERADGGRLRLRVRDDGVGAPAVDPARSGSLGLHLVRLLAAQLDATLSTRVAPGFDTVLEFPEVVDPTTDGSHA